MQNDPHVNSGSRARDHLANERTYLAWVRTAFGALALGVALERFGADDGNGAVVTFAAVLIVLSIAMLGMATRRYYSVAAGLDRGRFEVDRRSPILILLGAASLAALAVALFLV